MNAQVQNSPRRPPGLYNGPMPWTRLVADLLTLSRLAGGVALAVMPWERSGASLGKLVKYSILLWSTDAVDGKIARRSLTPPSRIGKHDIWIDVALTVGCAIALARMEYLPGRIIAGWAAVCTLLYWLRPVSTILLAFMFPLQLSLPVLAIVHRRPEVWLYVIWVAALAVLNWTRLKWVIEVFIEGLPDRQREWVWSWLPTWLQLSEEERAAFQRSEVPASLGQEGADSSA